ncbi:DUF928 domain-containing protein [Desertifilum sp. FACHB-1129]|uniref:DUF928 domain-containing protein n=2 Tax=Desertifilum tharense IPPAS B-1220 TaxID=1781255 RepID=A0ACD5GPV0_9CYAN|nr:MULTISPECIES: DUF928 domain-containing protein [Desertifilum]MBD2312586.1 DUF928 domain-containing protein [Desertifilum sp. FACHB-1129]MBD2320514.1 DUF928 domain-containing protein [Desertifilum sp. FACHB-866]MBD2330642.1 DUF928 domain-containing protein [Desertifilum sp. FACHB-868]MDA0210108.1 DUF928 domain-containing protein [Cyanobacteria bacterium FC1]
MFSTTSRFQTLAISLLSLCSVILSTSPLPGMAQVDNLPDVGLPGRRVGGGTRGPCLSDPQEFIAITPPNNVGTTLAEVPTFSVYLPANKADAVEIGLETQNGTLLYPPIVLQKVGSGIIEFSFPKGANYPPLEVGQNYKWYVQIICDLSLGTKDSFVEGWVRRVEPSQDLQQRLQTASDREKVAIYTQEKLWYDRLNSLIDLRRTQPRDVRLNAEWGQLLQEVQLGHLTQAPLLTFPSVDSPPRVNSGDR